LEPGEACDDRNVSACGGCNASCTMAQPAAKAQGSIAAVAGSNLLDGETFTLSDGTNAVIFEFDVARSPVFNGVAGGHVAVQVNGTGAPGGASSAGMVATAIAIAVNGVGGLQVAATAVGTTVELVNQVTGSHGNAPIVETVQSASFSAVGMTGGAAADCPPGTGCTDSSDCRSGVCTNALCQP
jgi:hypothetical protein